MSKAFPQEQNAAISTKLEVMICKGGQGSIFHVKERVSPGRLSIFVHKHFAPGVR